jgi:hypothetical protein
VGVEGGDDEEAKYGLPKIPIVTGRCNISCAALSLIRPIARASSGERRNDTA